jgi:hypothetical protein
MAILHEQDHLGHETAIEPIEKPQEDLPADGLARQIVDTG